MNLGNRIAVISDVHGEHRVLYRILERCEDERVESVVLLGDLFNRVDQAAMCARYLAEWPVTGVIGNHEREALEHHFALESHLDDHIGRLLESLGHQLVYEEAMFVHDEFGWKPDAASANGGNGHGPTRITFAGHTHYRSAKDDKGPLDISMGHIRLREQRRYLINPGAVVEGQYAIWDRHDSLVVFHRV
jgi:predicted phosphodiesterase